ncbi:hypothetical protein [Methanogenium organophilum]|uniref:Uncharacterized protein n=1 Tax=Methanogenium organophilum TaxID=2199 RepID=A0A9X9S2K3_METOG|nr:hypothetical protein [Methanogenium organophilum]WAI00381.1 hypothetical protein OU421_08035 [Methanogenium organophilum]
MDEEKKDNTSSPADTPRENVSPEEVVQKEPTPSAPETPMITEEEKQKIIEEERRRVENEEKMKKEAVKAYKKEHKKGFGLFKGLILLVVIIGVVVVAGYLTFDAFGNQNAWGNSYPYVATYDVLLPDSSEVFFGNVPVLAVSSGNDVTLKIGNERQILSIGTPVEFQPAHMTVKMYGLTLRESDYHLTITYRGLVDNRLDFLVSARTSDSPMSSWMRELVVPSQATVRPV